MKFILIAFIISGVFWVYPQDMLDNYLVEAADNNPGLKSKFNEYMAALEKIPQVGALPDPQLTFGYFIQPVETRVGPQKSRIALSQVFPWFGTLGAREDAATELAKSKYEIFQESRSRLFYEVKSIYYNLYFTKKAVDIVFDNMTILNTLHNLTLIKVEGGLVSTVDVLRVEMEMADLENQLALLKDNFFSLQTAFNNLLNVTSQRTVSLPVSLGNPDFNLTYEAALDSIRQGNHQVLEIEYRQASFERQAVVAKRMGKPNLILGLDYIIVDKSSNPMIDPSQQRRDAIMFPVLGITIPIYRKKYTSMVKEALLIRESTENVRVDKINMLETMFAKVNKEFIDAGRRILLYIDQSNRAEKALNILQIAYETNGKDFEDMLNMERQLLKYKLELEKARADKNAVLAFIHYLMGK
jgi:outer membrane protein TolC